MGTLGDWFLGVICEANRHQSEEKMEDMVVLARKTEEKRLNTRVEADMFGPSALGFLRGRLEEISAGTDEMQESVLIHREGGEHQDSLCETECGAPCLEARDSQ